MHVCKHVYEHTHTHTNLNKTKRRTLTSLAESDWVQNGSLIRVRTGSEKLWFAVWSANMPGPKETFWKGETLGSAFFSLCDYSGKD